MDPDLASIEKIRSGDDSGLAELMARHKDALFRFTLRYTLNEADAAELTEAAFVKTYFNASRYKPTAKVRTWVFSIAANLCRDHYRRNRKRSRDASLQEGSHATNAALEDTLADQSPSPALQAQSDETLAQIEQAIDALPFKLKAPFVFCVLESGSQDECSKVLGISVKTVETRIYRARKRLRSHLESASKAE